MLTTDRLILRAPRTTDLDAMFATYSDPRAMRYWSTLPHDDPSVTQALLNRQIADFAQAPLYFALERDGQWIGNAGLYRNPEVGFMLSPDHWGQGLIPEAMETLIPHLFAHGLGHLTADVDPRNTGSIKVLRALGFYKTHEAANTFLIGGEWFDSVYFRRDP